METRSIEITLETARRWYEQGGELKDIALGAFSLEEMGFILPRTFEEYLGILERWNISVQKQIYDHAIRQIAAVKKLILLRDFYNNDWKPKWNTIIEDKFAIVKSYNRETDEFQYSVEQVFNPNSSSWLVFNDNKHAEEFLENFRELIEQAGDLI